MSNWPAPRGDHRTATACLAVLLLVGLSSGFGDQQASLKNVSVFLGADDLMPKIEKTVLPIYPPDSHVEGVLDLEVVVAADGKIANARVAESPDPSGAIDRLCVDSLKSWKLRPALDSDGMPRATLVRLRVSISPPKAAGGPSTFDVSLSALSQSAPPDFTGLDLSAFPKHGNGIEWPSVIREIKPRYTREGMRARLTGSV